MQVSGADIPFVVQYVREVSGVSLDNSKGYLIESRLASLLRDHGCTSYRQLIDRAKRGTDKKLKDQIVDAITTHETLFFRDASLFEALRQSIIPEMLATPQRSKRPHRLRIWSAASSTGQEAYSVAMTLWEAIPNIITHNVNILGTDVSDAAVRQASAARYTSYELQRGLDPARRSRFFHPDGANWKVNDDLRSLLSFRRLNLLEPFPTLGPFDIIFCRNVAIYFDPAARRDLFLRLAERLTPDGWLIVGSAESLTDLGPRFTPWHYQRVAVYRPQMTKTR